MATRKELKDAFRVGAKPTASDFSKLIDSTLFKDEDGIQKTQNGPLIIKGVGDEDLIHFYKDFDERKAQLIIRVSQRTEAEGEAKGLNFTDQNGNSLLFLDAEAKKVKAPAFEGRGAELTQLNADHIATGTVDVERIPDLNANKITDGTLAEALLPALKWNLQFVIGGDKGKFVLAEGQPEDGIGRVEGPFRSERGGDLLVFFSGAATNNSRSRRENAFQLSVEIGGERETVRIPRKGANRVEFPMAIVLISGVDIGEHTLRITNRGSTRVTKSDKYYAYILELPT